MNNETVECFSLTCGGKVEGVSTSPPITQSNWSQYESNSGQTGLMMVCLYSVSICCTLFYKTVSLLIVLKTFMNMKDDIKYILIS